MFNSLFSEETGHTVPGKVGRPHRRQTPVYEAFNDRPRSIALLQAQEQVQDGTSEASTSIPGNPLLSLWTVATAVTNTVKARADELVKSVVDTDWRTELSQFSREVGEESKTLKEKTAELVEHLPEQVVHLPEKAEEAFHHLPAQVHLPKDVGQTLEGVSEALSQFGKTLLQGTKELIDELKEGVETEIAVASREGKRAGRNKPTAAAAAKLSAVQAKYNRFEAEVAAMQRDSSTYCDEPEDAEDYARWKAVFSLDSVKLDISRITAENAFMAELQSRLVPIIVEHQDFWSRYFYRLHKLQQKEEQRQQLAQRAKSLQEDEVSLGWGDEDDAPPSPPRPGQATEVSTTEVASAQHEVLAPVGEGLAKSEEAHGAPAESAAPTPAAEPPAPGGAARRQSGSEGPVAAAAGAPMQTAEAAHAAAAPPSEPTAAEHPAELPRLQPGSKTSSGGGASAGSSGSVEVESGQLEAEPHAETASDSSVREWCVVKADVQPSSSGSTPAEEHAAQVATGAASSEVQLPSQVGPEEAPLGTAEPPPAVVAAMPGFGQDQVAEADEEPVHLLAANMQGAKQAGGMKAAATMKPGDEEEVDEDWGNWD